MFSNAIFAWGGASDGEYHIYRNVNYELTSLIDELFGGIGEVEEASDPVPEGAELFIKAQIDSGKGATFTAKNCMIDPDILKQLIK